MGSNPLNLVFRFLLEIAALIALGAWGWEQSEGVLHFVLALGIPILAAALWGTFNVPDDPSRSGKAPVPVRGFIRLLLEFTFFAGATWSLFNAGSSQLGQILGIAVVVHYFLSYDRIIWLLQR